MAMITEQEIRDKRGKIRDLLVDAIISAEMRQVTTNYRVYVDVMLKQLSSLGVVIAVEGELPKNAIIPEEGYMLAYHCYEGAQQDMLDAGFNTRTVPLEGE